MTLSKNDKKLQKITWSKNDKKLHLQQITASKNYMVKNDKK